MEKHNGEIVKKVLIRKGLKAESLSALLSLNKITVDRLLSNPNLKWAVIATIGRLIEHDFSLEFPEEDRLAREIYINNHKIDSALNDYASVFLIDDSEMDIQVFKLTLKQLLVNVELNTFANGELAINKLLELCFNSPDKLPKHIFLDLQMPIMNGGHFLEQFHRLNIDPLRQIKIHVLTSSIFHSEIERYKAHPLVSDILTKPVNRDEVASIL
ncbi:response regulator [Mucilaginibacter pallidiroseus]|uniref:Response regulator n=1 Tax=Mucilaginibacter pallidiroseus TaxID=2599295 RepID=A0A563UC58_9SPHI|nr:response regulator [Mucilaginibacter pallidiroseus]TWR28839.1 response regulator [Mucilaginibacter pallidiroseus]